VSRRRRTPDEGPGPQLEPSSAPGPAQRPEWGFGRSAAVALGIFILVSLLSWAAGAANLGVALGIGQIAFGLVLVALMVWR
jgi:hypothetical protein